jgi:methionyl-tRNA synthetase
MSKNKEKFYLTTAIPFVNARPHIGFALEAVQADVIARYQRALGKEVFFSTGSDENSLKNVQAAEKEKISIQALCDRNAKYFSDLKESLNLSFDVFIRTTEQRHVVSAQKLWSACRPEDIYKKNYKGFYCIGCEAFYQEKELIDGKCPEHKTKPEIVEEENYFFRLSGYQEKLLKIFEADEYQIIPKTRKNEIVSFIKMGLEDFSISRSLKRAHGWGVPVPNDPSQIMYVWFDALANYLTVLDYQSAGELFEKFWPADVHFVGKGIIRFHAVYWPAMLLSAGLALPKKLLVHGYINVAGEKMSKSLGNAIDPNVLIQKYGTDAVRYFLLKYVNPLEDSDFTWEKFDEVYQADLSNGLGNLVSRTTNMIDQYLGGKIIIKEDFAEENKEIAELIDNFRFNDALKKINESVEMANKIIDETKPWVLAKLNDQESLQKTLGTVSQIILKIGGELSIFLPETSSKIIEQLMSKKIKKSEPLFPRK